MASFYSEMERVIQENSDRGYEQLEFYYGLDLEIHRAYETTVYDRVHREGAGTPTELYKGFIGILEGDDFFPSNDGFSGSFVAGFLYSKEPELMIGDTIVINSEDGKVRRFKIVGKESLGMTREIFTKWKLSAIGD